MKSISELAKIQAKAQFNRKRKDVIKNNVQKHKERLGQEFQEIMDIYLEHIN